MDISKLPPDLVEAIMERYKRDLKSSLLLWCKHVFSAQGYAPATHHELIVKELEHVMATPDARLMISMPPGSAKSTYGSVAFPVWAMARKPHLDVIAASHKQGMADAFGRKARDMANEYGGAMGAALRGDNAASSDWRLTNSSRYYAVGAGASVTGRRADIIIGDDVISGIEDANSDLIREKVWDWYQSDLITRLKPGGRVVMIGTRWHQDDLLGRLLQTDAESWRYLRLPALAEANDELGREVGDPLWAGDSYGYGERLRAIRDGYRRDGQTRTWEALFQQNPTPGEGVLFHVAHIGTMDAAPAGMKLVRAWDLAATAQIGSRDPDWTVGVLLGGHDGRWVVADVVRLRGGPQDVERAIVSTAQRDGARVKIGLPQDPGQAGKAQIQYLTAKLAGYQVVSSPETGDKATRAAPVAAQVNVGNFATVRASWGPAFIDELRSFGTAAKDDQVDALSRAFALLGEPVGAPSRQAYVPIMGR